MVKLKELGQLVVITILIASCATGNNISATQDGCLIIGHVNLTEKDFNVFSYDGSFEIEITNEMLLKQIKKLKNPEIYFYIDGKKNVAKGLYRSSSSVPENCDYFYPMESNKRITFYNGKLTLHKIPDIPSWILENIST